MKILIIILSIFLIINIILIIILALRVRSLFKALTISLNKFKDEKILNDTLLGLIISKCNDTKFKDIVLTTMGISTKTKQ